jgi:hypothetical protein
MNYDLDQAITVLERIPYVLETLLAGLAGEWVSGNEGLNTWSPYDVVGHLIHGEKTDWIPRMRIILSDDDKKRFTPFDRFAHFRESEGKSLDELITEFSELRKNNIAILRKTALNETAFAKKGIHPEFGEVTLKQLLAAWVVHDLGHISQIVRVMAKQYKEEIGPWKQYMTIVNK